VRHATTRPALSLLLLAALVASLVALPAPSADASVGARTRSSLEQRAESRLFARHNEARVDPGSFGHPSETPQPRFLWAEDVAQVARGWSDTMAKTRDFHHNPDFTKQTCCWTTIGENIAYFGPYTFVGGFGTDGTIEGAADLLMQMWMDSGGHRRNIMDAGYTQVGLGVTVDANNVVWATAVFRRPTASGPAGSTTYGGTSAPAPEPEPDPEPEPEPWDGPEPTIRDTRPACPDNGAILDAGFLDVTGASQLRAVNCLAWWRVTGGTTSTTYSPAALVRRDQMASFIARAIERSGGTLPDPARHHFADVSEGSPHASAINRLAQAGVIGGYADGTFGPSRTVTRAQMARFLAQGFEARTGQALPTSGTQWFRDTEGSALEGDINRIAEAGWAGGYGNGEYRPGAGVRRDHMAYFVTRWLSQLVDDAQVAGPASW
jgi:uncharacterized protein YkwD